IKIEKGVARYDRLPIKVQGQELVFKGSYDLAKSQFALSTGVPLKLLGKGVERELDKLREYLDPDLVVSIENRGTWTKPSIRPGKDFLDKVVKDAAKGALRKGLGDLLDRKKKN